LGVVEVDVVAKLGDVVVGVLAGWVGVPVTVAGRVEEPALVLPPEELPQAASRSAVAVTASEAASLITRVFANSISTSCSHSPSPLRASICSMQVSQQTRRQRPLSPIVRALDRLSPWWGPQLVVATALALDLVLPSRLTIGTAWLLPSVEGALLLGLVVASPHPNVKHSPLRRQIAIGLIGLVSAVNIYSLALLAHYLLHHEPPNGRELIFSGVALWVTNVLLFGLWYYELDRGGPVARILGEDHAPDFLFVQMSDTAACHSPPDWTPRLVDYLYTSLTNATAFSPTDTMPLTPQAKWLMSAQSLVSFVTIGLVVARAVNIL
jgi:hypothetical protein